MKRSSARSASCDGGCGVTHGILLPIFRKVALRAQRSENLSTIVIELTVLDTTAGDHDHVEGLCKIVTDSAEYLAQAALYLIPNVCALLYLCCNGYGEPALFRF